MLEQGIKTNLLFTDFSASWQVWQNMFIDMRYTARSQQHADAAANKNRIVSAGIRINAPTRSFDF